MQFILFHHFTKLSHLSQGDSAQMDGEGCTYCQSVDIKCTHDMPRKPTVRSGQSSGLYGCLVRRMPNVKLIRAEVRNNCQVSHFCI